MAAQDSAPIRLQVNRFPAGFSAAGEPALTPRSLHTGSGRYIPGSGPDPSAPVGVADPFTGEWSSRETQTVSGQQALELRCARSSGGGAYSSAALRHTTTNIYFPKTDAVTFEQANTSQIFGEWVELTSSPTSCLSDRSVCSSPAKLKELNEGTPPEHRLTEETLDTLEGLLEAVCDPSKPPPTLQQISLLWKAVHWPEGTTP